MKQTFILEKKRPKGLYIFAGLLFILNGSFTIYNNSSWVRILGILLVIAGIGYMLMPHLLISFGPKFEIDKDYLSIRRNYFGRIKMISWNDIKDIDLGSYQIKLNIGRDQKTINYQCDPDVSISIKTTINEFASAKGIQVTGG